MLNHAGCGARNNPAGEYRPRDPGQSLVYRLLQENLETFLARQKEKGRDVPRFVELELRGVLECGILACGIHQTQCGAVSFVQRYGGSLNLNVHIHMVCIDGVYAPDVDGRPRFYPLRRIEDSEIRQLTETLASRITTLVQRRFGESCGEEDPLSREQPWLAGLYAASVSNRIADGPNAGRRVTLAGGAIEPEAIEERSSPLCAAVDGFNLHAAVVVPQNNRIRLERLLRYAARPPFATDRLERLPDGRLCYRLKTPWRDGTTHAVFTPLEFIERLAALIPTPRAHLIRFSGVLGPAAKWRAQIVPAAESSSETTAATLSFEEAKSAPSEARSPDKETPGAPESGKEARKRKNHTWAELIQRVFAADATVCGKCGGKLRLISPIHPPAATRKILDHLGLPCRPPPLAPAARSADLASTFDWA